MRPTHDVVTLAGASGPRHGSSLAIMSSWRRGASLCAAVVGVASLLVGAPTASAHTDFESSSPAQGDVVAEPVSSVVLVFSADTRPVDDLVVALDANGVLQNPTNFTTDDQRTFTATFDPALAGGDIGIRWAVLGTDGHPLEGSFSFTVTAPQPTTTAAVTTAPVTTATTGTEPSVTDTAPADTSSTATSDETVSGDADVGEADPTRDDADAPATGADGSFPVTSEPRAVGVDATDPGDPAADVSTRSLDDFLAADSAVPGGGRRLAGRLVTIPALAMTIGALAFLALAMRGPVREIAAVVAGVRIAGVAIAVGALIHYLGSIAATGASFATGWTETPGIAMAIRLVGAIAVVVGLRVRAIGDASTRTTAASLSAAVIDEVVPGSRAPIGPEWDRSRWDPTSSTVAVAGVAVLVASFWFDGHTVTTGWRPLHALVNSVHVVAGGVWFGGVVTLAAVTWWRSRRGHETRIGELVVRFSSIATIALAAVAIAGLVLAFFVLDGIGDLTGTKWGRTLLLKTGAVTAAAALGAYNHVRLRPAIVDAPEDPAVRATLRSVLTSEAIILTFVAVVTCWLVAAST